MQRRILKRKLNCVVIRCGKPFIESKIKYLVQEFKEVANKWKTISYNADFGIKVPAVFDNIEIAKLCYNGEFGIIKENVIYEKNTNLNI